MEPWGLAVHSGWMLTARTNQIVVVKVLLAQDLHTVVKKLKSCRKICSTRRACTARLL